MRSMFTVPIEVQTRFAQIHPKFPLNWQLLAELNTSSTFSVTLKFVYDRVEALLESLLSMLDIYLNTTKVFYLE